SLPISALTLAVVPLPMVIMAMTAATPMTMPSRVSTERSALRRTERRARRIVSRSMRHLQPPLVVFDPSVEKADRAICIGGDILLVRDHHDRKAGVLVQPGQQVHDLVAALGIEIAGRFVGHQKRRLR